MWNRNVVAPHRGAERAQLGVQNVKTQQAEDGRELTVGSGDETLDGPRSGLEQDVATRYLLRSRISSTGTLWKLPCRKRNK